MERKTDDHPRKLVRGQLCFLGGNWIGKGAQEDANPLATWRRELSEELTLKRAKRDTHELQLLGHHTSQDLPPTEISGATVTPEDEHQLEALKETMRQAAVHYGEFLNTTPKAAYDAADPENKQAGHTGLTCYFAVPLEDADWEVLCRLQDKFGNLSGDANTVITSLDEIIAKDIKTAWAHDLVLRKFFRDHGFKEAEQLPLVPGMSSVPVGHPPFGTYAEYLNIYDVLKNPFNT